MAAADRSARDGQVQAERGAVTFSNSMIESFWRSLKHRWLFLHELDSLASVTRLVAFYVQQHNEVVPHSAFNGHTPDEMFFGTAAELSWLTDPTRPTRHQMVAHFTDFHYHEVRSGPGLTHGAT